MRVNRPNLSIRRGSFGAAGVIIALFIVTVLFFMATARVDAAEACAVTRFGAVVREEGPGLHLKIPFAERFSCFRTATTFYEVVDDQSRSGADFLDTPVDGVTRDGQPLTITFNVRYRIPPDRVGEIYSTVGKTMTEVNERAVKFHARSISRQQVQKFTATELYSGELDLFSEQVGNLLRPRFDASGVMLEYFEMKRPRFQPSYEEAIEAQQVAREQIETRANEAAAAEQEALRVANLARGESEAQQIRAGGEATAIALRGQAVRQNPEIISLNYIEALKTINWAILDGASVTPFLNLEAPGISSGTTPAAALPANQEVAPTPAPLPTPPAG